MRGFPDLFVRADGTRITSPGEWMAHRAALKEMLEHYFYGRWPGKPREARLEVLEREDAFGDGLAVRENCHLHINAAAAVPVSILRPAKEGRYPVITFNAPKLGLCPVEREVIERGYIVACFNRHYIVGDPKLAPETEGWAIDLPCSTIMAWGWGHSALADALEEMPYTGPLIATGHSRGGKAAICAGIYDERFVVVAPNNSGCGGAGALRILGTVDGGRGDSERCETVERVTAVFPDWFTEKFSTFGSDESKLPFDAHTLRALIAPRSFFCSEGEADDWANPYGTQLAWEKAQCVYDLLDVPKANAFHLRPGGHGFGEVDWLALLEFCDFRLFEKPIRNAAFFEAKIT